MSVTPHSWEPTSEESGALLAEFGIRTPREVTAATADDVFEAAASFDGPFALKAIAPALTHKSDVGGVVLGLESPAHGHQAALDMAQRIPATTGFLLQELVEGSHEMFIGARRDPVLGPFILVGLGGIWVELLDDVAIQPIPCHPRDLESMLDSLRAAPLLDGQRGTIPLNRGAIAEVILAVSEMTLQHPEIEQLDLNPLVVGDGGAIAVDRHLVCRDAGEPVNRHRGGAGIKQMLEPNGIVVVGASSDTDKVGGRLFRYLASHGYDKPLFAVNRNGAPAMGMAAYRSVSELPSRPDLACLVIPVSSTLDSVRECAEFGIPAIMIYSSGFAESGADGWSVQEHLRRLAIEFGVRIAGPNTAGIINPHISMCASITMAFEDEQMPSGNIGLVTQSGGLGSALVSRIWEQGAAISAWVSCGNEVDLTIADYLSYLVDDDRTDVIVLFIEALRDVERFAAACKRASHLGKPILVYKTGTTEIGRAAVHSHTAALAGDDRLYDAMFRSLGVVRLRDLQGLVDAAVALSWQPRLEGNRIAVVSTSGGACSVAADACEQAGLELPSFSADSVRAIRKVIPIFGSSANPVDVTLGASTNPGVVGDVIEAVMDEPNVDAILVVLSSNAGRPASEIARHIGLLNERIDKPVVVARIAAEYLANEALAHYREKRVPVYSTPERAVAALAAMACAGRGT
jgi:acetate---CoA ligase (ADP-forming)